jgi:hypothetical protein
MRHRFAASLIVASGLVLGGFASAADEAHHAAPANAKFQGEILDMACYMAHEAKGPDHASCAATCLKGGQPMGLLAADGAVYLLAADHGDPSAFNKAKEFAGKKVEIEGEAASRAGIKAITVKAVKPL